MKKLLVVAALAVAAYAAYQRYVEAQDERDLWAEVTDDVD